MIVTDLKTIREMVEKLIDDNVHKSSGNVNEHD